MRQTAIICSLFFFLNTHGQNTVPDIKGIETVIQTGHYATVSVVCFSPDGRFAVTGSEDKTIKLWEAQTGREVRSYTGSPASITAVTISKDGRYLASVARDGNARIWELSSSKLLHTLEIPDDDILCVDFAPSGSSLVTGTENHHAILWNFLSGEPLLTYKPRPQDNAWQKKFPYPGASSVQFSSDGKYLMAGCNNRTAILFDARTGNEIRKFKSDKVSCASCNEPAGMSSDARWLATVSNDSILIWDIASGKVLRRLGGSGGSVEKPVFSPDGKYLVANDYNRGYLWEVANGTLRRTIDGHKSDIKSIAFSPDNQYLITGSKDRTAKIWKTGNGKEVVTLNGYISEVDNTILDDAFLVWIAFVNEIRLSPDGKYLAIGKTGNLAKLMDFNTGRVVQTYVGHEGMIISLDFSPDGKTLATGSVDGTARLWEVESGKLLHTMPRETRNLPVFSVRFSADGKYLVTGGWEGEITVWDASTGNWLHSIGGFEGAPYSVAFSHNGLYVVAGALDTGLKLFELDTGKEIREFIGHTDVVSSIRMLPDGKRMVTGSWDGKVKIWDLATGFQLMKFSANSSAIYSVNIDKQGRYLVTGGEDNIARLWDVETGSLIRSFEGHRGAIGSVHISPDGRFLITGSRDGTIKTWDLNTGSELLTQVFIGKDDWMVRTREGFFDASDGAKESIFFVRGTEVFSIDQFFEDFYRPGLLKEVYQNRGLLPGDIDLLRKLENSPPPAVEIITPGDSAVFTGSEVTLIVKVTNTGGGISELRLTHNGKGLPADNNDLHRVTGKGMYIMKNLPLRLVPGDNTISVSAFSQGRIESQPRIIHLNYKGLEKSATCYVISIGINRYKNPGLDLNYARADAEAFVGLIREKATGLFRDIRLTEIYDLEATRNNILEKLDRMAEQIGPEDVFFFYYAGHGSMVDNQFYFIPTESVSLYQKERLDKESIRALDMQEKFRNIRALKQLVILDACQSGGSTGVLAQRGATEEKALAQLSRSSGVHVLAAAGSEQYASEFGNLGHGLFTFVILDALKGKADGSPEDGKVTIYELKSFVDDQVPELSKKYRGQPQYPYTFSIGHDFPVVMDGQYRDK